jgi:N-acetylglutamate synthase-like GNAT family acetyltransferase
MNTTQAYHVVRAKPSDAPAVAEFVKTATYGRVAVTPQTVVDRFGAKGLWLVQDHHGKIVGLSGWRAENLIARADDFLVFPPELYASAGKVLMGAIEQAAQELQCEVCMLFVPLQAAPNVVAFYESCGYQRPELDDLPRVWQETTHEATQQGRYVMIKKLREDLVVRPI